MAGSYFVCAPPRTGSSLLLGLLESTGPAGRRRAQAVVPRHRRQADQLNEAWARRYRTEVAR